MLPTNTDAVMVSKSTKVRVNMPSRDSRPPEASGAVKSDRRAKNKAKDPINVTPIAPRK
jgi:hypothetical protein